MCISILKTLDPDYPINKTNLHIYLQSKNFLQVDYYELPEQRYSLVHREYMAGEMTRQEFLDWYNNPEHYRPELPKNNRSHIFD
jgi:hypothetical protein